MATTIPNSIRQQVDAASILIAQIMEGGLVAVHLYGSTVEGGLKPWSGIDLLVTIRQPLNTRQGKGLMQDFLEISAPPGNADNYRALEVTIVANSQLVPWRFPPSKEMQFGEWLRDSIRAGIAELRQVDPDLSILLIQARRTSVALSGESAKTLLSVIPFNDVVRTF